MFPHGWPGRYIVLLLALVGGGKCAEASGRDACFEVVVLCHGGEAPSRLREKDRRLLASLEEKKTVLLKLNSHGEEMKKRTQKESRNTGRQWGVVWGGKNKLKRWGKKLLDKKRKAYPHSSRKPNKAA